MKKNRFGIILVIAVISTITSCEQETGVGTVQLQPTADENIIIGDAKEVILLETSPESLLDFVTKTYIDKQNNRIFVNSGMNVFLFDTEGNFITKLKRGNGPGEINLAVSFSVDSENRQFYVLDMGSTIHVYDYDANFIETHQLSEFYSLDLYPLDTNNLLLYCNYVGRTENYFVGIYDLEQKKITEKFVSSDESPYSLLTWGNANNFFEVQDRFLFSSSNIFGLFEFQTDTFRRIITYDLGDKKVPENFYSRYVENGNRSAFDDDALKNGFVPFIRQSFQFNDFFLVVLHDESFSCYAIDSKDPSKVYFNGQLGDYFSLPEVNSMNRVCGAQDDFLTFACSPLDFFEEGQNENKTIEIAGQRLDLSYDMNPFLIIVE